MALRVASLDYLGTVAARLRKDAVTSKMDQRSIDRILKDVNCYLYQYSINNTDLVPPHFLLITILVLFSSRLAMMRPSSFRKLYWITWMKTWKLTPLFW